MTNLELISARNTLKYSQADMSIAIETPKRTIQDWESGRNRIPGVAKVAVNLLVERSKSFDKVLEKMIDNRISQQFPRGIPSVRVEVTE